MALHADRQYRFARNFVAVVSDAHRRLVHHFARSHDHHIVGSDQLCTVHRDRTAVARLSASNEARQNRENLTRNFRLLNYPHCAHRLRDRGFERYGLIYSIMPHALWYKVVCAMEYERETPRLGIAPNSHRGQQRRTAVANALQSVR